MKSAFTIAFSYVVDGIIPFNAYLVVADAHRVLKISCAVTVIALVVFGAVKGQSPVQVKWHLWLCKAITGL